MFSPDLQGIGIDIPGIFPRMILPLLAREQPLGDYDIPGRVVHFTSTDPQLLTTCGLRLS
jgi:hypothetical protein